MTALAAELVDIEDQGAVEHGPHITIPGTVAAFVAAQSREHLAGHRRQRFAKQGGRLRFAGIRLLGHDGGDPRLVVLGHLEKAPTIDDHLVEMKGKSHALAVNLALVLAVVLIDKVVGDAQRLHVKEVPPTRSRLTPLEEIHLPLPK